MVKKHKFRTAPLILVIIISLFISFLKLSKGYSFNWDQSDDVTKVFSMIENKKPLLIGPRVSNDNGFFVGPYHYYFLLPFYFISQGDPIAGAYAVTVINLLTVVISFFLVKKMFNQRIAFSSSIILAIILGKTCWSAMYAPLVAIVGFYICYQTINHRFNFPLAMFFAGLISNIHLALVSLVPIMIISFFISKNKPKLREIIVGIVFFIIPFSPLIIFDFRHDFLNFNKLLSFSNASNGVIFEKSLWLRTFWRSLSIFSLFSIFWERLASLIILLISPLFFKKTKNKILIILWILTPLLLLSFYHGAISEYYYALVTFLVPLFIVIILDTLIKNQFFFYSIIFIFLSISVCTMVKNPIEQDSLSNKENIVKYLINQKQDQPFNLSYETEIGMDFGFAYLFDYFGNPPQNIDNAHLYTLFTNKTVPSDSSIAFHDGIYSLVRR